MKRNQGERNRIARNNRWTAIIGGRYYAGTARRKWSPISGVGNETRMVNYHLPTRDVSLATRIKEWEEDKRLQAEQDWYDSQDWYDQQERFDPYANCRCELCVKPSPEDEAWADYWEFLSVEAHNRELAMYRVA